jgi:beta-carotene hydroxylase
MMQRASREAQALPRLDELGRDLLSTTPRQRVTTFLRPCIGLAVYVVAVAFHQWWLTPLLVFLIFVAVVTATHDVVHGSLGLSRRQTEWALFCCGAFLLESGHAYRTTHLQHHRLFPHGDDPEGDPARMSTWRALCAGPTFLPRLWLWSFRQNRNRKDERSWLLAEAAFAVAVTAAGLLLWRQMPGLLLYVCMVVGGSWVYPLLTVHLPHRHYGDTPLTQTHTLRGRIIPVLFLELTYHLEHHLYPQVPSHHLGELSRRLDPVLAREGVCPRRVP